MGKKKSASGEEFLGLTGLLFTCSQGMASQVCPLLYPAHGGLAVNLNILTFKFHLLSAFSSNSNDLLPPRVGRTALWSSKMLQILPLDEASEAWQGQQWGRMNLQCSSSVTTPPRWRAPGGQHSQHRGGGQGCLIPDFESPTPLEPSPALVSAQTGPSPGQSGSCSPKQLSMRGQGVLVWFGTRQPVRITELDWMWIPSNPSFSVMFLWFQDSFHVIAAMTDVGLGTASARPQGWHQAEGHS